MGNGASIRSNSGAGNTLHKHGAGTTIHKHGAGKSRAYLLTQSLPPVGLYNCTLRANFLKIISYASPFIEYGC